MLKSGSSFFFCIITGHVLSFVRTVFLNEGSLTSRRLWSADVCWATYTSVRHPRNKHADKFYSERRRCTTLSQVRWVVITLWI
jgi:hypothetical protein